MDPDSEISPWDVEASLTVIRSSNWNPSGAKDPAEAVTGRGIHNRGQKKTDYSTNEKVTKMLNKYGSKGYIQISKKSKLES